MGLLEYYLSTERNKLIEQGVRFRTIGRTASLPASALQWVRAAEQETAHLDKLQSDGCAELRRTFRNRRRRTRAGS